MTKDWSAPSANIQRSMFDRSHAHKTTFNADELIPICVEEVLPGDTANVSTSAFMRLSTPIYPIMDNMKATIHWFFVPLRLVWDNAEQFFGEDLVGGDGNAPVKPLRETVQVTGSNPGSLEDYMGIPAGVPGLRYDELPLRCYYEIWNQWYRSQDLQELFPIDKGDLPNDWSQSPIPGFDVAPQTLKRNKRHDYFTSCLPWPAKQVNEANIPIINPGMPSDEMNPFWTDLQNGGTPSGMLATANGASPAPLVGAATTVNDYLVPNELMNDNAGTINQLRIAFAIQRYFERSARGGSRYPETIKAHFNVDSPDARLQRPEYLGRNVMRVNVTPVATTFESTGEGSTGRTVGDLGAMGTASAAGQHAFVKSFTEHGFILGLLSVTADLTYQQGLHKMWRRDNRFNYFWPAFQGIGEQGVSLQEIWAGDSSGPQDASEIFGYQERYAEYRYAPSRISGLFRSAADQSLDAWHLSEDFTEAPALNETFITSKTPMDRVLAVTDEPNFIADFYFHAKWARPMTLYGVPGNIDRF